MGVRFLKASAQGQIERTSGSSHLASRLAIAAAVGIVVIAPWAGSADAASSYPPVAGCTLSAQDGGSGATVTGTGFAGSSTVTLTAPGGSTTVSTNPSGSFSTTVAASSGATLTATDTGCVANAVFVSSAPPAAAVTPGSSGGLASTGAEVGGTVAIGLGLILAGGLAVRAARGKNA